MSYIVPKKIPMCCGICPCFHAEHPMHCQAVKADKNKMVYAPYEGGRPDWCPLIEVPTPHGRLIDKDKLRRELFVNFNGERIPFYDCDNFPTKITYRDLHSILAEQKTVIKAEE